MIKALLVILSLMTFPAWNQVPENLIINKKTEREISPGQKHSYKLNLKADQFCLIIAQQQGVDLLIKTLDPSGSMLEQFDSPNGKQGPEVVTVISSSAGAYTLEVMPFDEKEPTGKYSIELVKVEPKGTTPEKLIDQLMSALVLPGNPGATIAVANGDKILLNKGYGSANPEYDIPNSPKTIFHIASISKQFTAFAIAMLADQGKLSLDDDIRKYLPELNDFGSKITIRQLIYHTSGLRDQWNLLALAGWRLDDVITRNQVLRLISHQKELNFKPGDEHSYCNTGYTLMGEIVSRVGGKTFSEWTTTNIFKPLAMNNTFFYDDHEKIVKNRAYSFYESPEGLKKSVLSYANAGATSLFTTAEDLVKWSNNFYTMKVGNSKIMAQMNERGVLNKGDTISYMFGQVLGKYKGLKTISHGGADAGYRSFLVRFPDQKYTVVVLSNLASFNTGSLAYKIADIYLKEFLKPDVKKTEENKTDKDAFKVSEELLKLYAGKYEIQPGFILTITTENGKLIGQATGQPPVPLEAKSESEFENVPIGVKISFQKNSENLVHQLTLRQGTANLVAPRVKEFDASSVDLSSFTGTYYSPELETSYTLVLEGNKLIARHIRNEQAEMTPISKDVFNSTQWYMSTVEFTRNEKQELTGLKASSGRVKNVRFDKVK